MTGSLASVHPELIPEWSEKNLSEATSRTLHFLGLRWKSVSETLSKWTDTLF